MIYNRFQLDLIKDNQINQIQIDYTCFRFVYNFGMRRVASQRCFHEKHMFVFFF